MANHHVDLGHGAGKRDKSAEIRKRFAWLQTVLYDRELSAHDRCVAFAIAQHVNARTDDAWPSVRRLSRLLGFATRTVVNSLTALEGSGHIGIVHAVGRGNSNHYVLKYAPRSTFPKTEIAGVTVTMGEAGVLSHA